ncbi:alpha/beta fold hydrolase [Antarcticimicrobium luteum]|uniref:Alpha/beta fold hydrolase n=1 Tax=Antarcticimicrobium luteum TaxID=2547397 RepID=A0A4R5VE28_9RHOB|nr:alpha/beta fold hydrolase [Antarcticimicrobium luteum]TDK50578.1 alpha/beta fold hydrolase [Antarcticimicrobium luteum]
MADFLLIHGSCHGAWCWRDVIPALEALGHTARAIDMPSHGDDPTPIEEVTLEGCRDAILAASTPETIVVGHSWGGYPISAAGEAAPDRMRALIYLCAYVPVSGLSMIDMRKRGPRQPLMPAVRRAEDGLSYTFDADRVPELFYHDCPDEAVAYAMPRLCPQATRPQTTPLTLSARWEGLPKAYIRCANDQAIPPEYQAEMVQDWPRDRVASLPTSHSPFFADPAGLAALIDRLAAGF